VARREKNFNTYKCARCDTLWGHLKFAKQSHCDLERKEREKTLYCLECENKIKCAACNTWYSESSWSMNERKQHRCIDATLVCRICRDKGCTARDTKLYTCQNCECQVGSKKFDKNLLYNFKHRLRPTLICISCLAKAKKRERTLKDRLRQSKRICKCFCMIHKDKCPLSPVYYGERRWPGSDGFISEADRIFLDELKPLPEWWARARGRKSTDF